MESLKTTIELAENTKSYLSDLVPRIAFRNTAYQSIAENYLSSKSRMVLELLLGKDARVEPLEYSNSFFVSEFGQIPIDKIYELLFSGLGERDTCGRLVPRIRWCITFDLESAPNKLFEVSPAYKGFQGLDKHSSEIRNFGTVEINGSPVLYIIYFKLEEILDYIKKHYTDS
jgi:hypothetical protein